MTRPAWRIIFGQLIGAEEQQREHANDHDIGDGEH